MLKYVYKTATKLRSPTEFKSYRMQTLPVVTMTTKTILLIHKEPNIQEVVQACLIDLGGWNVRVANNSTSAGLQHIKLYQPDAIILDVSFGKIDVSLFLQQLRAEPPSQEIPVVLITFGTKWFELQRSWFQKYQVAAVIINPLNPAMLSVQIANVLGWDLHSHIDPKLRLSESESTNRERVTGDGEEENHFM